MASRRSGLLLFRQISAYHQSSTFLLRNDCQPLTLFSNNAVASSFPISLNNVRQHSSNNALHKRQPLVQKYNDHLNEDIKKMLTIFNKNLVVFFSNSYWEGGDIMVDLDNGKERKLKDLCIYTQAENNPFMASIDLSDNPSLIPAIKKNFNKSKISWKQKGNVLVFDHPLHFIGEDDMARGKKAAFQDLDEYWKKLIVEKFTKPMILNGLRCDFDKLYKYVHKPQAQINWKNCEIQQKLNNAKLRKNLAKVWIIKIEKSFIKNRIKDIKERSALQPKLSNAEWEKNIIKIWTIKLQMLYYQYHRLIGLGIFTTLLSGTTLYILLICTNLM